MEGLRYLKLFISLLGENGLLASCRFARIDQLGSHWTDFYQILYLNILKKLFKNLGLIKNLTRERIFYKKT